LCATELGRARVDGLERRTNTLLEAARPRRGLAETRELADPAIGTESLARRITSGS